MSVREEVAARCILAFVIATGGCRWLVTATHRLKVIFGRVVGHVHAEQLALNVPMAIVQARPDASVDELGEWLRERVERAHPRLSGREEGGCAPSP